MISNSRAKLLQIGLEALIPVLGYWFWNWSLYFILLFFFIDLVADEVISHLKSKRIVNYNKLDSKRWFVWSIISTCTLFIVVVLSHFDISLLVGEINFGEELMSFWRYKDMGIEQGYILVPLVVFAAYQQYKMEFLAIGAERKMTVRDVWRPKVVANGILMIGALLAAMLIYVNIVNELILVHLLIAGIIIYKIIVVNKNTRMFF